MHQHRRPQRCHRAKAEPDNLASTSGLSCINSIPSTYRYLVGYPEQDTMVLYDFGEFLVFPIVPPRFTALHRHHHACISFVCAHIYQHSVTYKRSIDLYIFSSYIFYLSRPAYCAHSTLKCTVQSSEFTLLTETAQE